MKLTTIYLVRHAQAEGNLFRRMQGQYDSNLTPFGLQQLSDLKARFASVELDACYTSDLTRAHNTALAVCASGAVEPVADPSFREVGVGVWEDVSFGYLTTFHAEKMLQFGRDPRSWSVPESEDFRQYTSRFLSAMEAAAKKYDGGAIAIVSHSVVMQGVLSALFPRTAMPHSVNTSVSCLEYDNGDYRVRYLNDFGHLQDRHRSFHGQKWRQEDGAQKGDVLWFRPGASEVDGLTPTPSPVVFTALEGFRPVGLLCLSEDDAWTGRVDYLGLTPSYRGFGLSVQLLGQAVSFLRQTGKRVLRLRPVQDPALEALCGKLAFAAGPDGDLVLDLARRLFPVP